MASTNDDSIKAVQAPWKLKGTVYSFPMYSSSAVASNLENNHKSLLYSPLEADSSFANGKLLGGVGAVQVIRYSESPVGPYDEMLVIPGTFGYNVETVQENGEMKVERKKGPRITRIYVSQKYTCWNGRTNWNIPKHLAHFTFTTLPDKSITIIVLDASTKTPFFKATFKPIPYIPSIPVSTDIAKYIGLDLVLVQPPLPKGEGTQGELPGTDRWCQITPYESTRKASIGWWDMRQTSSETDPLLSGENSDAVNGTENENWWPGSGRWRIGIVMEDANIDFPEGKYWKGPNL